MNRIILSIIFLFLGFTLFAQSDSSRVLDFDYGAWSDTSVAGLEIEVSIDKYLKSGDAIKPQDCSIFILMGSIMSRKRF